MRTLMLLAGVAALGLSAPILAQGHGGGHGGGHGNAGGGEQHGGGHGNGGGHADFERGGGEGGHGRGHEARAERGESDHGRMNGQQRRAERAIEQERRFAREGRGDERGPDFERREARRFEREDREFDRRDWRDFAGRRLIDEDEQGEARGRGRRLAIGPNGCPPGLARHNVYCMPPGQLRKSQLLGQRLGISSLGYNIPDPYRYRFTDNDRFIYRYGNDGTVYRLDRGTGLVNSIIPLTASGLMAGEPLPLGYYDVYNVPFAYRSSYPDSRDYLYRYDGNAIYRVNSSNMLVDGIVALLTGGTGGLGALGVGDRLPLGYSAYNVPLAYRDTYYDTPDALYRYADGSIYQVDPRTQLIEAVISTLV